MSGNDVYETLWRFFAPRSFAQNDARCHSRAFRPGIRKHAQLVANKTGARQTNKSHGGGEVDDDIENIMADIGQDLLEIESSILVVLSALKNEFNPISLIDADNHLELVLGKISETIKKYRNLNDNLKN